jgi:2-polyprenyl-3-methyl-5-hydroxy-6-metoxy-1,4-benzoquinol methylase
LTLGFTGERIVPGASDCEPNFAQKMYQEHIARYAFAAQFASGADVLDVGCGVGYGSQFLAKADAKSVLGVDISSEAIEHARKHFFHPAVTFSVQDATAIATDGDHDLITCFELIEHVEEQQQVLDRIKVALRPGGLLAISTPRPLDDIRTHFHVHEMSFEELHGMLKQRFRYVEALFQVNCFTSFVGRELADSLDQITPVTDRIRMEHADYFVFLASDEPISSRKPVRPVLTMNDDRYILTLEHDVGVLRHAEHDHLARIADQEREKQHLASALADAENRSGMLVTLQQDSNAIRGELAKVNAALAQPDQTAAIMSELASLSAALTRPDQSAAVMRELAQLNAALAQPDTGADVVDAVRAELAPILEAVQQKKPADPEMLDLRELSEQLARLDETAELRRLLMDAQVKYATVQSEAHTALSTRSIECDHLTRQKAELEALVRQQAAELVEVRRVIAETSHRLAEAETRANMLATEAGRLADAHGRVSVLENETNAMRYRLDYAERTLARFRGSLSWTLTKPVRWIGRTFKTMTGRSLPQ